MTLRDAIAVVLLLESTLAGAVMHGVASPVRTMFPANPDLLYTGDASKSDAVSLRVYLAHDMPT